MSGADTRDDSTLNVRYSDDGTIGMIPVNGFAIKPVSPPTNNAVPRCRLFYQGQDTGRELTGAFLEASVQAGNEWLLFLTHDVPFEETLEIVLLDRSFEVLDRASLIAPNATGAFRDLQILSDRCVRFNFIGQEAWELKLLERPGFRLPLIGEPFGVVRPFGFSRRFALSKARGSYGKSGKH
jgi:hypothetical protein